MSCYDNNEGIGVEHPDFLQGFDPVAIGQDEIKKYQAKFVEGLQAGLDSCLYDNFMAERF